MQRTQSSIKNLTYALIGQAAGLIVSFLARVIFVRVLSAEYLGLNGLFTNILTMLSLVELGVGPAMNFSLYKPLAENDTEKVKSLMALYKNAYYLIGVTILVLGFGFTPFYKYLIAEVPNIPYLNTIYILFVINSAVSYFYSYKRSLIISDQKRYIATIYRYGAYITLNIVQVVELFLTHNYILFLVVQIVFTWIENYLVSKKANKLYPYITDNHYEKLDSKSLNQIKKNITAMVMHKVGGIVVNSTDNIIISKFIGLAWTGLYSNYFMIITALNTIISQLYYSIVASVGNLGATDGGNKMESIFYKTFFLTFWIYGFTSICLLVLFNPFVSLWLGYEYLLDQTVIIVIVINYYLGGMRKAVLTFREAAGAYWHDRYKPVFESVINLVTSIILAKYLGISGVFLGTIISTITTCLWIEPYVAYKYIFHQKVGNYFVRFFTYTLTGFAVAIISICLASFVNNITWVTFTVLVLLCASLPNLIFLFAFHKTEEFKYFRDIIVSYVK